MAFRYLAAASIIGALSASDAHASIGERVVAVVGEHPILLSELRQRARPYRQEAQLSEILNRMIDEQLEQRYADRARIVVTPREIDARIKNVASEAGLTPEKVLEEAKSQGRSEQEYRDEIGRQIIAGKLVELYVRKNVRVTEQDERAAYARWLVEGDDTVDLRVIAMPRAVGDIAAQTTFAENIVQRVRSGTAEFCQVAAHLNAPPFPTTNCGSHGPVPRRSLLPEMAAAAHTLKPGELAAPIVLHDEFGGEFGVLVVQRAPASPPPAYEAVREKMLERAYVEATARQRKRWLQELRRGVHVEIRL